MTKASHVTNFERARTNSRPSLAACSVDVNAPAARAFDLFTGQIGRWWPLECKAGAHGAREIFVEPRASGRIYERNSDGREDLWGTIAACVPGRTIIVDWKLDSSFVPNPKLITDLEIFFADNRKGSSHVTIVHTRLENFGPDLQGSSEAMACRWRQVLDAFQCFAKLSCNRFTLDPAFGRRDADRPAGLY